MHAHVCVEQGKCGVSELAWGLQLYWFHDSIIFGVNILSECWYL